MCIHSYIIHMYTYGCEYSMTRTFSCIHPQQQQYYHQHQLQQHAQQQQQAHQHPMQQQSAQPKGDATRAPPHPTSRAQAAEDPPPPHPTAHPPAPELNNIASALDESPTASSAGGVGGGRPGDKKKRPKNLAISNPALVIVQRYPSLFLASVSILCLCSVVCVM